MSRPGTQTRRQKVEEKEQAIVAAAYDIFLANGFDGARIAEIARRAQVAEGTVYLYFENKQALLIAVLTRFYDELTEGARAGIQRIPGTADRLSFLARHHLVNVSRVWQIFALTAYQYQFDDNYRTSQAYQLNRAYVTVFDQIVQDGQHRGEIRSDLPLTLMRDMYFGSMEYMLRTTRMRARDIEAVADDLTRDMLKVLLPGFAVPGATAGAPAPTTDERLQAVAARLERVADRIAPQD